MRSGDLLELRVEMRRWDSCHTGCHELKPWQGARSHGLSITRKGCLCRLRGVCRQRRETKQDGHF